jgi:hypothetical protein
MTPLCFLDTETTGAQVAAAVVLGLACFAIGIHWIHKAIRPTTTTKKRTMT